MAKKKKKISSFAKDALEPFRRNYTKLLLGDLIQKGILKESEGSDSRKLFSLVKEAKQAVSSEDSAPKDIEPVIQSFLDFREIVVDVYQNLGFNADSDRSKLLLSSVVEKFETLGVFKMPGQNISRLKDILDKGKILLEDEEITSDILNLFKGQNFNFAAYIFNLFQYYTQEKAKGSFRQFQFEKWNSPELKPIDVIGKNLKSSDEDLIIEVKYRKKAFSSLKESLFQCYEQLTKYNRETSKNNFLILLIYTEEGPSNFERLDYRFKKDLVELFPDFEDFIFFLPVYTGNIHLIDNGFKSLNEILFRVNRQIDFNLQNQPINISFPVIDDHYYEDILQLEHCKFEISLTPIIQSAHWRFGLKFSKNENFPKRTERHAVNFPLFHLEKNPDSTALLVSYYNETRNQEYAKKTSLLNYKNETVILQITQSKNGALVNVLDSNFKSIIDAPQYIPEYNWFEILAWADNVNPFEFKVNLLERIYSISKPQSPDEVSEYFVGRVIKDFKKAQLISKRLRKPIFMVIYDGNHPTKSKLKHSLGYFTQFETTKKLIEKHFVQALIDRQTNNVEKLIPKDNPLENCLLVIIDSDQIIKASESVYANPEEGLKRTRNFVNLFN